MNEKYPFGDFLKVASVYVVHGCFILLSANSHYRGMPIGFR
jgi:hypothetical protein